MFNISRRTAAFTHLNIRGENHGKKKIPAVDLSINFTGKAEEILDILVPSPADKDNSTSEFFFTESGHLRVPTINPIAINRSPEGLSFTIFDRKDPMVFREGKATGFVIELQEGGTIKVNCKLQGIPDDGYTERLKKIVFGSIELAIESEQDDLFSMPPPKEKAVKGKDDKQTDIEDGGKGGAVARLTRDVEAANGKAGKAAKKKAKAKAAPKKKASGNKRED